MSTPDLLLPELERRTAMLPAEIAHWKALADANNEGMGIHRTQFAAVELLFEELFAVQTELLAALRESVTPDDFTEKRLDLENALVGAHGIMAIFRYILAQRADPGHHRRALDAADLVAADCYRFCMGRATAMDAISEDRFREPPLTYLNSMLSPAAFTRRHFFGAFKLQPDDLPELRLPVSVISLPFHHTVAAWTYCSLYHEVGHPLDQDLGLQGALTPLLTAGGPGRQEIWRRWLREMIADIFGVLLGGAAYARSLAQMLFLPASEVTRVGLDDPHPTPYVRIFLVGALLREGAVPDGAAAADDLEREWTAVYGRPPELSPLVADCAAVARTLLDAPLAPALQGHRLREFAAIGADEHASIGKLARFLHKGLVRPSPSVPPFPYRLVPAATQTAVHAVREQHAETYEQIHQRALQFIEAIPRPEFLSAATGLGPVGPRGLPPAREAYLRELARKLDFRSLS